MRVLIWTPPWPGQGGDLYFAENAFRKHLFEQARTLTAAGWSVTVAVPDTFNYSIGPVAGNMDIVTLPAREAIDLVGGWHDPSLEFYRDGQASTTSARIGKWLAGYLPKDVDIVLQWETPVPYLRALYPDALIVNQMPGSFSRAPYPHLVTFDPNGLYRSGTLNQCASAFMTSPENGTQMGERFTNACRKLYAKHRVHMSDEVREARAGKPLTLLPLQISEHYAFQAETGYTSQAEYCLDVLGQLPADEPVLITQYISRLYSDKPITPAFYEYLRERHPNAYYDFSLEGVPSVSQYLLQEVDQIVAATTGLAVQALAWDLPVIVPRDTHLRPLDRSHVNSVQQRVAFLTNVLGKLQPLASMVVSDGAFLSSLLEELHARRNRPPEERLVEYATLVDGYEDKLLSAFREHDVPRELRNFERVSEKPDHRFREAMAESGVTMVSFDLFDTLVVRHIEAPADLYGFLEQRLRDQGVDLPIDFAQKRLDAELRARSLTDQDEIQLSDIYRQLREDTGLSEDTAAHAYREEIELEIELCVARPTGKELWSAALRAGKRICITSDMYLPETCIRRIVEKAGFKGFEALFVSSTIGKRKKTGKLFSHIVAETGLPANKIIHVGDTINTDIVPAREAGLQTFYLERCMYGYRDHDFFKGAVNGRGPQVEPVRSAIAGLIASHLFDDPSLWPTATAFRGDPFNIGYAGAGPALLGFTQWLRKQVAGTSIETLHFLSREGLIMKQAFDRLELLEPTGVNSNYLYGSRRAIRIAGLQNARDIADLLGQTIDVHASVSSLIEGRFGVPSASITPAMLERAGIPSADAIIRTIPDYKLKLRTLCEDLGPKILENAAAERETYLAYLKANGFENADKVAIVDIGWGANMQGAMGQLLGAPLTGFYFATLSTARKWLAAGHKLNGYVEDFCANTKCAPLLNHRLMIEDMFCDTAPSVIRIERLADGNFHPVFKAAREEPERTQSIRPLQKGALQFVDDACVHFGDLIDSMALQPDITTANLTAFLEAPMAGDAAVFEGRLLDDSFSGSVNRYLLAPQPQQGRRRQPSYWTAGALALDADTVGDDKPGKRDEARIDGTETLEHRPLPSRLILKAAYVPLKSRFTDYQKRLYKEAPREIFKNFRNPLLIGLGKLAGVR